MIWNCIKWKQKPTCEMKTKCLTLNCNEPRQNYQTNFCKKHKCSHCNNEANYYINVSCVEHKDFSGGPYTYPNKDGKFEKKY